MEMARDCFLAEECHAIENMPAARQQEGFFRYWTLKESYLKARGTGLSIPCNRFGFHFEADRTIALSIDPSLQDAASGWCIWQFEPSADHLAAVCATCGKADRPQLTGRKIVPLLHEEPVSLHGLRASGRCHQQGNGTHPG
jgi:4'-phosphopantetheinyl transferase